MERWKAYPGFSGAYEVSTFGGVRTVAPRRVGGRWMPARVLSASEIADARIRPDEMARQVWGAEYVAPAVAVVSIEASPPPVFPVGREPIVEPEVDSTPKRAASTLPPDEHAKDRKPKRERR